MCNSENARQMWVSHQPQYVSKLKVIYNSVTLRPVTSEYVPKKDGKLHIVVAASYLDVKNPMGMLKALSMLSAEERANIHIDWYGKNDDHRKIVYGEMRKKIFEYSLDATVSLHPATEGIHNVMNEADIVALFSKYEGLPNAICEGMTLGKPIIMTRVSDYSVLVDERNGFLCYWDNSETIKDVFALAMSLTEDELLRMGACSRERAEKLFANESIRCKWTSLIQ